MSDRATCPICDEPVEGLDENDAFPFCSTRCKRVDLAHWFDESYTVPMTPHSTERSLEADDATDDER